jgi:hypothetical protein
MQCTPKRSSLCNAHRVDLRYAMTKHSMTFSVILCSQHVLLFVLATIPLRELKAELSCAEWLRCCSGHLELGG